MTTAASTSWMPASGRHSVSIGSSLGRALKARKSGSAPKATKIPDRDFYSFRYNFKPESVDSTKPGTIEVRRGKDTTSVTVERASAQTGEGGHVFLGQELPAREWDCVLIYDEEMGTFTLEKLDSYVNLTYDRKTTHAPRHPGSPLPPRLTTSASTSSAHTHSQAQPVFTPQPRDLDAEIERELLGPDEDAEGEPDDGFAEILPVALLEPRSKGRIAADTGSASASKAKGKGSSVRALGKIKKDVIKREEEESEGEIVESKPLPKAKTSRHPRAREASNSKPAPAPQGQVPVVNLRPTQPQRLAPTTAKPAACPSTTASLNNKRAYASDVEEETLEFGRPAQPAKRARASPSPKVALGPVLPPSSSAPAPALPAPLSFPGSSTAAVSLPPAVSDSEEDWDEVQPPAPNLPAAPITAAGPRTIEMEEIVPTSVPRPAEDEDAEEEEEIDLNAFQEEINMHLGTGEGDVEAEGAADDDEDFLAAAVSPVAGGPNVESGGAPEWGEDEDYSSSDESDDD
ncbi:hypothetical protein AcV7_007953 [Taiwanofungus camphoratus]|nr:hypothetical protein AcV7_007953 [Antrodia cinnamomea]